MAGYIKHAYLGIILGCTIILIMFIQLIGHLFEPQVIPTPLIL
jgi:hypothetical protein